MTTEHINCKKQIRKQGGFFGAGIGLGLFLLFSGMAAMITTTSDDESKDTVAQTTAMQPQTAQSQYYVATDPEC